MSLASTVCNRCIIDTTVPGIHFDAQGECNFCKLHDSLEAQYPIDDSRVQELVLRMKNAGKGRKYDCVCGVSGGRDSTYTLHVVKKFGLRALAVHFNDGFGNPVAGDNIRAATKALDIPLITISSDWRESKDIKIAFLKASTPDLEEGTDVGIATALFGAAVRENVRHVIIGQSFRTEGVMPLKWSYLDGTYLHSVHRQFGTVPLRPWNPRDPGFNLTPYHMFYYTMVKGIRTIPLLYNMRYVRSEVDELLKSELGWIYPGAHYFDDLYQSLMAYVLRVKFNCDRRKVNYSALIRSGQMKKEEALALVRNVYVIEDQKVIDLCIKRLGLTREQFDEFMKEPPKTFMDYSTSFQWIRRMKWPIALMTRLGILPQTAYAKYFDCAG